jgi:hypothetical protein
MTLPVALQPFAHFRQFISYTTRPSATKPGKLDKLPTNWQTGELCNAHDPNIWTDYETAYACGGGKVGFVFTDNDPFWFLDVDNCYINGEWSPLVTEILALLPGAACEVSISGKGLHFFGTGGVTKHRTDSTLGSDFTFYNTKRFVALSGHEVVGSAATDCTMGIRTVVDRYFSRPDDETPAAWTTAPDPAWLGPTDDDDLIRRMRNSKSAAQVFGSKATPDQLWIADFVSLSKAYPDDTRGYDASSADAALAQHLAFWTGKDCARIQRIMKRSQLTRDKWDRDDYLPRTILSAISKQKDVLQDKPAPAAPSMVVTAEATSGSTFLNPSDQMPFFDGCVYVADINRILVPGGDAYNKERFDVMRGGLTFVLDMQNDKVTRSAWDCFTGSQAVKFPKANTSAFKPTRAPGEVWDVGGQIVANSYWPVIVPSKLGNPRPFLEHLQKLLPDDNDRAALLAYMAAVVQHKGVKFKWAPLIQGTRGNGKTLLSKCVAAAIGKKHCHWPKAKDFATAQFNAWMDGKIFIAVEDIYVPHDKQEIMEALKPLITGEESSIEGKGVDQVTRDICCNLMLNSNHKDAVRMTDDNRGIAPFFTRQQTVGDLKRDGMDGDYFPNLYEWLKRDGYAIVTNYLENYPIPAALNPARDCHRAPRTTSTSESIRASLGTVEQEILRAVAEDRVGFRAGWISTHWLDLLLRDIGLARSISHNRRATILEELGYIRHPALANGQVNNPVAPDGHKSTLWTLPEHPNALLTGSAAVAKVYSDAQLATEPAHLQLVQSAFAV